ncbi:MAG: DUF445 family protein [Leptospirales bacterium]|nr:DUF445 family protein [Leptospirales bacterium]
MEKWGRRLAPRSEPREVTFPSTESRFSPVLFLLKLLPYLCVVGFGASIFFDFSFALQLPWRGEILQLERIVRTLCVTGLVGYGTNWLAIKMLFYPRKKRPLLGQGLIPSRKNQIVIRLGEQISKEIINSELIVDQIRKSGMVSKHRERITDSLRSLLRNPEFRSDIMEVSQHYINEFLRSPEFQQRVRDFVKGIDFENVGFVEGGILRVYKMLTGDQDISSRLQDVIGGLSFRMDKYEERLFNYLHSLPDAMEEQSHVIEDYALNAVMFLIEQINVQEVIIDNLQRFDEVRLERLLWRSTSDQLQYIQYLGCFLGLLGAVFVWMPVESIVGFTILGALVYGLDTMILRMREKRGSRSGIQQSDR